MLKKKTRTIKTERVTFRTTKKVKRVIKMMARKTGRRSSGELIHDVLEEKLVK